MHKEHEQFLDMLRVTGVTNMWGASPYLRDMFPELSRMEAKAIVIEWIKAKQKEATGQANQVSVK